MKAQLKKSYWAGALLKKATKNNMNLKQNLMEFSTHPRHPNKFQPRKHVPDHDEDWMEFGSFSYSRAGKIYRLSRVRLAFEQHTIYALNMY